MDHTGRDLTDVMGRGRTDLMDHTFRGFMDRDQDDTMLLPLRGRDSWESSVIMKEESDRKLSWNSWG